jgi:glycosyltransferase involved in cell wall biosynthesis
MIELTIGMPTYNDYDGLYFTLQALRLYQDLDNIELLVVDNYGCEKTRALVEEVRCRYLLATDVVGSAAPKNLIFHAASGDAVLCCDCHVLFVPGVIRRLKQYFREHPASADLLQGPLLNDDGRSLSTHQDPAWHDMMWGQWATDPRGDDPDGEPFDIPMQGMGAFSCRKSAWLGFNPRFRGFGGEEGYIHEKFRRAGRRCLCLPWLRWMHRFRRTNVVPYPMTVEDRIKNYVIGHLELGLGLEPVVAHFKNFIPEDDVISITVEELFASTDLDHAGTDNASSRIART